jgi:hypothetical protein
VTPQETTLVIVTPREWRGAAEWQTTKVGRNEWKGVRVIDGIALEDWLERHPAVAARLARQLLRNMPQNGVRSTDEFWDEYSSQFEPTLGEAALLAGRGEEAKQMLQHLQGEAPGHLWQADSLEEVTAFAVATIRTADPDLRRFLEARTLVVDTEDAAHQLANRGDLVFLVRGTALPLSGFLVKKAPTVVPIGRDQPNKGDATLLRRPRYDELAEALKTMGLREDEAQRVARECGRSVSILKRRIRSALVATPNWGEDGNLIPALLASGWNSSRQQDTNALAVLIGDGNYSEYEKRLLHFLRIDDPPIEREGTVWQVRAPVDAFVHLGHLIGQDDLRRFEEMARQVYGERDPALELSREEQFYAGLSGKVLQHSDWLRTGIATTLLMIAVFHAEAGLEIAGTSPQEYVDRLVSGIPGLSQDYRAIASLYAILPLIAEAAPRPLLQALSQLVEGDGQTIRPIFSDNEVDLFHSSSPHCAVLWALEVLAWDPKHIDAATLTLAKLARIDPGGRLVNRPINSLRDIFVAWHPNTNATLIQRLAALDQVISREPDVGWELVVKLLPEHYGSSTETAKPRYRESGASSTEEVTYGIVGRTYKQVIDRVLTMAGESPERWAIVARQLYVFSPEDRARALSLLANLEIPTDDASRKEIWEALRGEVNRHKRFSTTEWAMSAEDIAQMDAVAERFLPPDLISQTTWLFDDYNPDLPEEGELDQWHALQERRKEAVTRLYRSGGLELLGTLVHSVKYPVLVAYAFVEVIDDPSAVGDLARNYLNEKPHPDSFAIALSGTADFRFGTFWREFIESQVRAGLWTQEQAGSLASGFVDDLPTWEFVASLGSVAEKEYWTQKGARPLKVDVERLEFAVEKYLAFGRAVGALEAISYSTELPSSQTILRILDAATREINANPALASASLTFEVGHVLHVLRSRNDVPQIEIAKREYAYLPMLRHAKEPLTIHNLLSQDPELYVEVLCDVYKPASGQETEVSNERRERASAGYRLISGHHVIPGMTDSGIDEEAMRRWVTGVRELATVRDRAAIADQYIGHILAHAPHDEDGAWPHRSVRSLLEQLASSNVERGLLIERFNMRGVVAKSPYEGGDQERQLATTARDWSETARRWPRTSALLRTLAEDWERHAKDADLRARQDEMRS